MNYYRKAKVQLWCRTSPGPLLAGCAISRAFPVAPRVPLTGHPRYPLSYHCRWLQTYRLHPCCPWAQCFPPLPLFTLTLKKLPLWFSCTKLQNWDASSSWATMVWASSLTMPICNRNYPWFCFSPQITTFWVSMHFGIQLRLAWNTTNWRFLIISLWSSSGI